MGDGFYRSKDPTNSIKVLKEKAAIVQINRGWVTLGPNLGVVSLGADPSCWVCKERTSQANQRWNYFWRIPTYVITIHQRHRWTDRRTDRETDDMRSQYRALH